MGIGSAELTSQCLLPKRSMKSSALDRQVTGKLRSAEWKKQVSRGKKVWKAFQAEQRAGIKLWRLEIMWCTQELLVLQCAWHTEHQGLWALWWWGWILYILGSLPQAWNNQIWNWTQIPTLSFSGYRQPLWALVFCPLFFFFFTV